MTETVDRGWLGLAPSGRTLLSALAITAALPPWGFHPLLWVALVPWLDGVRRAARIRYAAAQGFWLAFCLGLLVAPWVAVAIREFTGASWLVAISGLLAFAAILAQPQLLLFAPLLSWAGARRLPQGAVTSLGACAGLACAYTGFDSLVPRLFDVGLGYGLHGAANLRQLADLGGVPLLTTLVVLVNLLVLRAGDALLAGRAARKQALAHAALVGLIVAAAWGYGRARNEALRHRIDAPDRTLRASIVQGNVPNAVRLAWAAGDDRAAERQLSAYTGPTEEIIARAQRPDFVVWPEATFPGVFGKARTRAQRGRSVKFDRQVLRLRAPIAFGAYDIADDGPGALHNALFLVNPDYEKPGRLGFLQRYHKHVLLPFAETLPGLSEGSWLHRRFPTLGFFAPGTGTKVLRLSPASGAPLHVSPIICSEALDASHVAAGARLGSQLILNIGSDGWFGASGEPEFHLAIARLRSVETRLPQVRAANTGISALILPDGEIATRTALGRAAVLDVEIPIETTPAGEPSLFTRFGFAFGPAAGMVGLAFVGLLTFAPKA